MKFGIKTDTGDSTGKIIEEDNPEPFLIDTNILKKAVESLTEQIPPIYSAIKVNGQRAYKLARKEEDLTMESRPIKVTDFQVLEYSFPNLIYQCQVSKGTYIRSLTEQIAEMFHTIATTTQLTRLSVSNIRVEDAIDLEKITEDNWSEYLLPIEHFLDCPVIDLTEEQNNDFWYGRSINLEVNYSKSDLVIVKYDKQTKGLGKINNAILFPTKVFK